MKLTRNMAEGNIYRNFLYFSIPLILSSLLSQAYTTIDAVIAGKFISEHALGAISATGSYDLLLNSLFSGFAAGFGIYTAQQFGKAAKMQGRHLNGTLKVLLDRGVLKRETKEGNAWIYERV